MHTINKGISLLFIDSNGIADIDKPLESDIISYFDKVKIIGEKVFKDKHEFNSGAILDYIGAILNDRSLFSEIIQDIASGKGLKFPDPYTDKQGKKFCVSNKTYCSHLKNFIEFKSSAGKKFYLVQNHQFVAGIYFPSENLYLKISGGHVKGYLDFLANRIYTNPDKFNRHTFVKDVAVYPIVSCPRPWHFFYNFGSTLQMLHQYDVSLSHLYYMKGGDFFNFTNFYDNLGHYCQVNQKTLDITSSSGFLLGTSFDSLTVEEHDRFGLTVREKILNSGVVKSNNLEEITLWVGITSQKRKLVNQVDCLKATLLKLSNKFGTVKVLVDGWTSPITPSVGDFKQIENDHAVLQELIKECVGVSNVYFLSVIGLTAEEKMKRSLTSDVYVSNYASGSIYVSRFMRLNGVSHLNNDMPRSHQIHYNNVEIPYNLVKDIEEEGKTGHHISYEIDPEQFSFEVISFLTSIGLIK